MLTLVRHTQENDAETISVKWENLQGQRFASGITPALEPTSAEKVLVSVGSNLSKDDMDAAKKMIDAKLKPREQYFLFGI